MFVVFFIQVILAHQSGVGPTQTSRWKRAAFKCKFVVVASEPSKFGQDPGPSDFADAGSTNGACHACPIVFVGRGVVQVLRVAAIGGGGPRRFGAGRLLCVGFFAFDGAAFAALLAKCVLVLFGWAGSARAIASAEFAHFAAVAGDGRFETALAERARVAFVGRGFFANGAWKGGRKG